MLNRVDDQNHNDEGCKWTETLDEQIVRCLQEIKDPEMPTISLIELGMVHQVHQENGHVEIDLIPTFMGCPALDFIRRDVETKLAKIDGVRTVTVRFIMDIPWTTDRMSEQGLLQLHQFGIAAPPAEFSSATVPHCVYCGSEQTHVVSLFGPTACRAIYYCTHCKQPFEGMKFV
ncbi:1,2-phenylacetyl-CoA epoxidase subunit PaaD [Sulfoacidibacillus ferrooxidans]|uniref:1,2-phenylacetyl-CoA epoxidase, subunit D n=1 Tax=Sulfoacidibacillus ferrooxidans TaxID=2005001 RepID=A0A9X2ACQ5_9BACL|nr:1,2-phenylacetyl-CoA epoxidase subunit PaaD [Sulfoacidibacillus ferrooxidans]MCI0184044.1 putative 1,2-phenylacetyl-CoA epoxidase, subunit D [Sulfoacidibacillus ferrooxidans]